MEVIFLNTNEKCDKNYPVIFFSKEYLSSHSFEKIIQFSNEYFEFIVSINNGKAISLSKSLFGSFWFKKIFNQENFNDFVADCSLELKKLNIKKVQINHPPTFCKHQVSAHFLKENKNFHFQYAEINQHINLHLWEEESIHKMEQRKLRSLKTKFYFKKLNTSKLEEIHSFISGCRKQQNLEINISLEQLIKTQKSTNGMYECFGVYYENELSSACITARINDEVIYYYLPATLEKYKKNSPMVMLLSEMCQHYRQANFRYFDLGISSIKGVPQEGLRNFKNRMGAEESQKTHFEWIIQ